jgi:hypothetical protein
MTPGRSSTRGGGKAPPPPPDLDPDPHQDFELDPDPHQNNADPQPWAYCPKIVV